MLISFNCSFVNFWHFLQPSRDWLWFNKFILFSTTAMFSSVCFAIKDCTLFFLDLKHEALVCYFWKSVYTQSCKQTTASQYDPLLLARHTLSSWQEVGQSTIVKSLLPIHVTFLKERIFLAKIIKVVLHLYTYK